MSFSYQRNTAARRFQTLSTITVTIQVVSRPDWNTLRLLKDVLQRLLDFLEVYACGLQNFSVSSMWNFRHFMPTNSRQMTLVIFIVKYRQMGNRSVRIKFTWGVGLWSVWGCAQRKMAWVYRCCCKNDERGNNVGRRLHWRSKSYDVS